MTDAASSRAGRTRARRVLVGVDGSADSLLALRAAARAAGALGAELVVASVRHGVPGSGTDRVAGSGSDLDARQQEAVALAFGGNRPALRSELLGGVPGHALMAAARDADLLVVGARGTGGFPGLALGSTALLCVLHAPCPVLVVREGERFPVTDPVDAPGVRRVVVGVDGPGLPARSAVRAALRAAAELDAGVLVVSAWRRPDGAAGHDVAVTLEALARTQQQSVLDGVLVGRPAGSVRRVVRKGSPAAVLLAESAGADLLVVGADARDTMTGALLGPVALTVASHATVPVLVLRGAAIA